MPGGGSDALLSALELKMKLSVLERKMLWTRAGNRCSYRFEDKVCDEQLISEEAGVPTNIGVECHIVGEKATAARYIEGYHERGSYSNAILMCANHHKKIDDNEELYTVEVLHRMKDAHEQTIRIVTQSEDAERLILQDTEFKTVVDSARRAVGMQVDRPAQMTNVRSELHVREAEEAIGFSTNQPLTTMTLVCSCGNAFARVFTGTPPPRVACPHCGQWHDIRGREN